LESQKLRSPPPPLLLLIEREEDEEVSLPMALRITELFQSRHHTCELSTLNEVDSPPPPDYIPYPASGDFVKFMDFSNGGRCC
jgi:hypothetical protein